jgi:hypothetical protein
MERRQDAGPMIADSLKLNGPGRLPLDRQQATADPWEVLARASDGRLLFLTGHGVRACVVNFTVAGQQIMLHLPDFNEATHYVRDSHVVLEAIATVDDFRWKVHADGDAAEIPDCDVRAAIAEHLEQWPTGVCSRYIVIEPTSLTVEPDPER